MASACGTGGEQQVTRAGAFNSLFLMGSPHFLHPRPMGIVIRLNHKDGMKYALLLFLPGETVDLHEEMRPEMRRLRCFTLCGQQTK